MSRSGETRILKPERSFFPSSDPTLGAVSRYFAGEATSEVGLHTGLRRDLWTVVAPNTSGIQPFIDRGDQVFRDARSLPPEVRSADLGQALRLLVGRYRSEGLPVTFEFSCRRS